MNYLYSSIFFNIRKFLEFKSLCCGFLVIGVFFCAADFSFANNEEIAPERDIVVASDTPLSPNWKVLWDDARNLARDGQYVLAADAYAQLFTIKPYIEEANWEYCKILLQINSYDTAAKIIALLLENNPNKSEYLLVAGQVAAKQKKYAEAERFFGLIFEKDPVGKYSDSALSGLAYNLRARGLKNLAFPLMQQLIIRQPSNISIIHDLALDAVSLKRYDHARRLYRILLSHSDVDDRIIFQAASIFDETGLEEERDAIYQRYLDRHPDYLPFRMKLMKASEFRGDFEQTMFHLSYLIEHSESKGELLLKAARISQQHLNRPDKALGYLQRYHEAYPQNSDVTKAILDVQEDMAHDFLSIVENGGAELLWNDLETLGNNRQSIFMRMAHLLEAEKKRVPLINILKILYKKGENTPGISLKLAQLHYRQNNFGEALQYLLEVPKENHSYQYYKLKADSELHLGKERAGLASLMHCLELKPEIVKVRRQAIKLAGQLGYVKEQQTLFNYVAARDFSKVSNSLLRTHIEMLSLNRIYGKALDVCERALAANMGKKSSVDFYMLKSDILRKSGKKRRGEQLLRQLIHVEAFRVAALIQLARNAIDDHNLDDGRKWLRQLDKSNMSGYSQKETSLLQNTITIVGIRLLLAEGETELALEKIEQSINDEKKKKGAGKSAFTRELLKEQYRLYLTIGDLVSADRLFKGNVTVLEIDAELLALRKSYSNSSKKTEKSGKSRWLSTYIGKNNLPLSRWFEFIEKEVATLDYPKASQQVIELPQLSEESIRLSNIEIDIALARGENEKALTLIENLKQEFPAESYYCKRKIEVLAKSGDYNLALDSFRSCYPGRIVGNDASGGNMKAEVDVAVFYARLLWGNKQYEEALAVYRELLDPPVYQQLIEQFKTQNIDYQYLTREQTFWSSMTLMLESDPDIIAELMEPGFLFDNRNSITGKIVSDNFEMYSWQKLIADELLARRAIFNKNYRFAAKSYEKLLEKDKSIENKVDLATIYNRIGEYRKEAQVYEDLTDSGDVTPELQDSITENILKIRPTNTIDANLKEREGRDGVIDIRKSSLGTTFWFTPDLNKDFWFNYAHNRYESTDRKSETSSHLLYGSMSYGFKENYEITAGLGTEKFNDSSNSETQYNVELEGQLDDFVSGFVHFQKEPVDDSVASIDDNIYRRNIQTGMIVESELGISFGGDIKYSVYSDENERNRFYLYSSYSIFGESLQFDMRYSYQYLTNKDFNGPDGILSVDINNDSVKSYWSPESFSEHRLGVQVKKDFFGYLTDFENKMSYFLLDSGISLEDEENVAFSTRFNFFLEMSPHLLLKGNFSFNSSDVYKEKLLSLSLHYSW